MNVANQMYNLFEEEFHRNYMWVEDVLFTGILPILSNGNITLISINQWLEHGIPILLSKKYPITKSPLAIITSGISPTIRQEYAFRYFSSNFTAWYYTFKHLAIQALSMLIYYKLFKQTLKNIKKFKINHEKYKGLVAH